MAKEILFGENARTKLFNGIEKICKATSSTLGPSGRPVMFDSLYDGVVVSKDGVTVAKEVELEDPVENMGASFIKEVSSKSNEDCGDGSTTVTVLTHAIIKEGLKATNTGVKPISLKKGLNDATNKIVDELMKMSSTVSGDDIKNVAIISANNDIEMGTLVENAISKVGENGTILVKESQSTTTSVKLEEGMQIDEGFLSPYFITDKNAQSVEFTDCYILICDKEISSMNDLIPTLEKVAKAGKPLLIIAEDVNGEALASLVMNNIRGVIKVCAVKAPGIGNYRKELLGDIAVITNGEVISEDIGTKLDATTFNKLGIANSVKVTKDTTTIVTTNVDKEAVNERVEIIKNELTDITLDKLSIDRLKLRLARLTSGVAVIEIGATTEVELKEMKYRLEDALSATRAAVEEGIVAGGGSALLKAASTVLTDSVIDSIEDEDEKLGYKIIKKAIEKPLWQIVENAGFSGDVVVSNVKSNLIKNPNAGYNAKLNVYTDDMINDGIIDPTKVTRCAIQNATSMASTLLTTDCIMATIKEKQSETQMNPMGM